MNSHAGRRSDTAKRRIGFLPVFDPTKGMTLFDPPARGTGAWSGGHDVIYDEGLGKFLMYYRVRNPRALGEQVNRGAKCYVAWSDDGLHFEKLWEANKGAFGAASLEKGSLIRTPERQYRLYLSYENATDHRWQIDLMEADDPSAFDPSSRRAFLTPDEVGAVHVKDPFVMKAGTRYYVFANSTPRRGAGEATLVAVSRDGRQVDSVHQNIIAAGDEKWDSFSARLTSIFYHPPLYHIFYDGASAESEICEESCGCFLSYERLKNYRKVTVKRPLHEKVRYLHVIRAMNQHYYYYEYTRADGSHELRVNVL